MDHALFADLYTEGARLVRATTPPDIGTLSAGDMVICTDDWDHLSWVGDATAKGVHVRTGAYRYETERVVTRRERRCVGADYPEILNLSHLAAPNWSYDPDTIEASTSAFAATWDALSATISHDPDVYTDAAGLVPDEWLPFLPYPTLNPAQMEALPHLLGDGATFLVAPTGAGKTVVGMLAALREITQRGGKAVWLVPQRSLTSELDREMDRWRKLGMKVVALSGETATDQRAAAGANLWVATTEKFEALCRATSMRETIAAVGTLIVDEIHLLGEPSRGPTLETLLARIRGTGSGVRLIGLSATASNADEVAAWLGAELVTVTWRPTRLTQQILAIPDDARDAMDAHRFALASSMIAEATAFGGGTLVFCGTKATCRAAALAIAASRGVNVRGIDPHDSDAIAAAAQSARVGIHYSDWPHKRAAEQRFRDRTDDVLVATTTLAAGVNTPARHVIILNTSIGPTPMEVSTIQQMAGRAGRAGQETEGWSYLMCPAPELPGWRKKLAAGYTIRSGILPGVADHILGEIVQKRIRSEQDLEQWWVQTLAYHQGTQSLAPAQAARQFLETWRFITAEAAPDGGTVIEATALGAVTSRMMVGTLTAANLISALAQSAPPGRTLDAEDTLIRSLANGVTEFEDVPAANEVQAPRVARVLAARGVMRNLASTPPPNRGGRFGHVKVSGPEVVQAGLLLLARSPGAFRVGGREVAGCTRSLFNPAVYDSPRFLAWAAAAAQLGAVPGWVGPVASDLGTRITHYRLGAPRGAGRLLRLCEAITGSTEHTKIEPLWRKVMDAGTARPDQWPFASPPSGSPLTAEQYAAVLAGRLRVEPSSGGVRVNQSRAAVFATEDHPGAKWRRVPLSHGSAAAGPVVAATTGRDWDATGWLSAFTGITSAA